MSTELTPDCSRIRIELAGLLYGELAGDARAAVELHLTSCAACREELAALRETLTLLSRWETPAASDDPRVLARDIAAQAPVGQTGRRARLVRLAARFAGVAAALLFTLSLLNTRASLDGGRFQISFALPGAQATSATPSADWVRNLVAQEVSAHSTDLRQDLSLMTREEMQKEFLRYSQVVDLARAQDQRVFDAQLTSLGRSAALADREQRQVITDLASCVVPVSNPNR